MTRKRILWQALLWPQGAVLFFAIIGQVLFFSDFRHHFETCVMDYFGFIIQVVFASLGLVTVIGLSRLQPRALLLYAIFAAGVLLLNAVVIHGGIFEHNRVVGFATLFGLDVLILTTLIFGISVTNQHITRPDLVTITIVTTIIAFSAWVAEYFNERAIRMRIMQPIFRHADMIKPGIVADPRFREIRFAVEEPRGHEREMLLSVSGRVKAQADLAALQKAIDATHPPVPVKFTVHIDPAFESSNGTPHR